uniref:Mannosyltransferase n=1 Tax=Meloidogyne javanica TaxID=6303 RepID=A0A915M6U1_MELJA
MGKLTKNFALLKRSENQRISRRRLQENSSFSSNVSSGENDKKELFDDIVTNWKDSDWAPSISAVFKVNFLFKDDKGWSAMFGASCAFLPSSFSMSLNAFASAFYLFEYWSLSIFCTAISALIGWPFSAILGLPIERFLFPIYPHICLLAAICLDFLYRLLNKTKFATTLCTAILIIFVIASFSRIAALHRNYSGFLDIYKDFNNKISSDKILIQNTTKILPIRVCIGKEWHRFPSSFFLPESGKNFSEVEMRFIRSEFRALLPDIFPKGSTLSKITRQIPIHQNDENREQLERYVPLESCNFLIDLVGMRPTELEPDYSKMGL